MRRTPRALAVALVAVGIAMPAVGRAAGPRGAEPPASLPRGWNPEPDGYAQLLDARGSRISALALQDLQRDLLAESGAAIAEPGFVFPARGGDQDGDGAADVLTFEFSGEAAALVARDGHTGTPLWERAGAFAAIVADLDDGGTTDTIVLSAQRTGVGTRLVSNDLPPASVAGVAQQVSLVRGGETAWTYVAPGVSQRLGDPSGSLATDLDAIVAMGVIPDATGDGLDDVWLGSTTFTQYAFDTMVQADLFIGRTVDGVTGLEVGRTVAVAVNGLPWIVPSADVSGDGLADAFAFSALGSGDGLLSATTLTGAPLWARAVPTRFAYPSVHDLRGSSADVVLQAFSEGGSQRLAYSGVDGSPLWARPDGGYIDAAGDLDGDGSMDFIRIDGMFGSAIEAVAWSGRTGADLWGPVAYPAPEGAMTVHCICTDDLTGDGIWDPLTAELIFSDPMQMQVRMLDGATGAARWAVPMAPAEGFPIPLGVDADADGAADLGVAFSTGTDTTVRAVRGLDAFPLWSSSGAMDGSPIGFYGEDLIGDADPEFVLAGLMFIDESIRGSAHAFSRSGHVWSTHH